MSDEYRQVLLAWATNQLRDDVDVRKILDVRVDYSRGGAWSEVTFEDASLDVVVDYEDSAGRRQQTYLQHDEEAAARSLSKMLGELLKLADLQGDEIAAGKTRISEAQRRQDEWWERITAGAELALFLGDEQKTPWKPLPVGVEQAAVFIPGPMSFSFDAFVLRNDTGVTARISAVPSGAPVLACPGSEFMIQRPIVEVVSVV